MIKQGIKHYIFYFKKMMKFYELKVQGVPQVLFILILSVSFGISLFLQPYVNEMMIYYEQVVNLFQDSLSGGMLSDSANITSLILSEEYIGLTGLMLKILGFIALQQAVMMILSFFYMGAYMVDIESDHPALSDYTKKFIKALPRYFAFNLIFYICALLLFFAVIIMLSFATVFIPFISYLILILPAGWFIIQVIFIFKDITFLDTGVSAFRNFSVSFRLSSGNRLMIGRNIFFITCLNWLIRMVAAVNSVLLSLFILSFLEVIVLLIRQRLITLMYISETRVEKNNSAEIDML